MTINEYQKLVMGTFQKRFGSREEMLLDGVMGLYREAGEALDMLREAYYQGHEMDLRRVEVELGEVARYLAMCALAYETPLESIFELNIEIMRRRYPDAFRPAL